MFGFLLLAFLVVPILELYVFVQVSQAIGFGATVFWIVAVSIIGAWLVRREGLSAFRRANEKASRGEIPTDELVSGILILFAGALMLTPGFLTDAAGLLLLFPPSRALFRSRIRHRFAASGPIMVFRGSASGFGSTPSDRSPSSHGDTWDADAWEEPPDETRPGELG